jgi:uncharacterized SAM-binding protein YcdF (DUF218 family)
MRLVRRFGQIILRSLATIGLLVVIVVATPLTTWWATALAGPWDDPKGDVLIVLGGSLIDRNLLGANSYLRSIYATLAWREDHFHEIILSGGDDPVTPIALLMKDVLVSHGVPAGIIHVEGAARNTRENALFTKPIASQLAGKKILMTSDFHMFRAYRVFRKAGIDVEPRPFPDVRKRGAKWQGRVPAFFDLISETVKIGYYWVRGWI